jgi:predicted secreted protein
MSTRGWIGKYCPNCCSMDCRQIFPAQKNKNGIFDYSIVQVHCPDCEWVGFYDELISTKEEFKNIKRTKLIDKCLEKKILQN